MVEGRDRGEEIMPVSESWWEGLYSHLPEDVGYLERFNSEGEFEYHFRLYVTKYYLVNTTKISLHKSVEILKAMGV